MCPPDSPCWGHSVADVTVTAKGPTWLPGSLHLNAPTLQHRCSHAPWICQDFWTSACLVRSAAPVRLPDMCKLWTNVLQSTNTTMAETESTSPGTRRSGCPPLVVMFCAHVAKCFLSLALIDLPYKYTSA